MLLKYLMLMEIVTYVLAMNLMSTLVNELIRGLTVPFREYDDVMKDQARRELKTQEKQKVYQRRLENCITFMIDNVFHLPPMPLKGTWAQKMKRADQGYEIVRFCKEHIKPWRLRFVKNGTAVFSAIHIDSESYVKVTVMCEAIPCMRPNSPYSTTNALNKFHLYWSMPLRCGGKLWNNVVQTIPKSKGGIENKWYNDRQAQSLELYVRKKLGFHYNGPDNEVTTELVDHMTFKASDCVSLSTRIMFNYESLMKKMSLTETPSSEWARQKKLVDNTELAKTVIWRLTELVEKFIDVGLFPLDLSPSNVYIRKKSENRVILEDVSKVDVNFRGIDTVHDLSLHFTGRFDDGWYFQNNKQVDLFPPEVYSIPVERYLAGENWTKHTYIPNKYTSYQLGYLLYIIHCIGSPFKGGIEPEEFYHEHDRIFATQMRTSCFGAGKPSAEDNTKPYRSALLRLLKLNPLSRTSLESVNKSYLITIEQQQPQKESRLSRLLGTIRKRDGGGSPFSRSTERVQYELSSLDKLKAKQRRSTDPHGMELNKMVQTIRKRLENEGESVYATTTDNIQWRNRFDRNYEH